MIRKNDLEAEVTVQSKKSSRKSAAKNNKKRETTTYIDGSGHEDIVLAKRRGVFGTALIFLAILLLVLVI